jgi:elongation factor Ts
VLNEGKAPEMVEKIVNGKIKKELKEVCLTEQKFVKDDEMTVKQYIDKTMAGIGKTAVVVSMVRYEIGEGIEKKEENFADEVAKMAGN